MQTKANRAMLTSVKMLLKSLKSRVRLILNPAARTASQADVTQPRMIPSSAEDHLISSQTRAAKGGAANPEVQALLVDLLVKVRRANGGVLRKRRAVAANQDNSKKRMS